MEGLSVSASVKARVYAAEWISTGEFFNDPAPCVKSVTKVIRTGLGSYFRDLGVSQTVTNVTLQGWVALTRKGDYQTPDIHRGATIRGVYYVAMANCEPPAGCIDCITPIDVQEATFLRGYRAPIAAWFRVADHW